MKITANIKTTLLNASNINYTLLLPKKCNQTLFWLHGYREHSSQLLNCFPFEEMAEYYQMAIVFPDVPDTYYMNQPWNQCYTEDFLISEFIPAVIQKYNLPANPKSTFLAGISMGGFGALLIGSRHPELFAKIACISGAFIIDDILIGNPEVIGSASNINHFQKLFGDIETLENDPARNPLLAANQALSLKLLPVVYLSCGREDLLYTRNRKLLSQLESANAHVTWAESEGNHDWNYFSPAISRLFTWLSI